MFETPDGIIDISGYSIEERKKFFYKYPDAEEVKQGASFAADPSESFSSFLPEEKELPEGAPMPSKDILTQGIQEYEEFKQQDQYSDYRQKGAERKPEDAAEASFTLESSWPGASRRSATGKMYIADVEVELEDGSKIFLTPNEMQDPDINPNLKAKEKELESKFILPNGQPNLKTFENYEEEVVVRSSNQSSLGIAKPKIVKRQVEPYKEDKEKNRGDLKDLKKRVLDYDIDYNDDAWKGVPEQYRYWEGAEPPEDIVIGYTAYLLDNAERSKARTSEYDKAVAGFTFEEQKATEKQAKIEQAKTTEFLESDPIKNLDSRLEAYKSDPRYIQNVNIISKFEYGEELSDEEIRIYKKNETDLVNVKNSIHKDYEEMAEAVDKSSDLSVQLDLLKRDYSLFNKFGFNAVSTTEGLALGGLELLEAAAGLKYGKEDAFGIASFAQERRKIRDKARENYRPDVDFDDAFSSLDNFTRFIVEESGRQLPIFALIYASGGAATALGASEMGAALASGLTLGSMSAGQQIGDMTYEEFLSKYNDIQQYGFNLESNDKEYSSLNKFLTGVGFGAAEGLLGAAPTYLLGSRFFKNGIRAARATEQALGKRLTSDFMQKALNFGKPLGKAFVLGSAEEAVTEGLTTLTQNVITRNPNVFEGVGHATFSGGFFGGIIGGGAVSMGVAMNASMNPKERLELQNFYDQKQKIKTELQYEGLSPEIKKRLEKALVDIDKKIDDKTLEVEERWLSKMSRKNFEQYTEVLGKQADLKQQYLEVTNKDSGLTEQQKKDKVAELVKKYQANHARIEEFRNPLDYANRWHLLESVDKKRYDKIRTQASQKILSEGFEATEAKIKKEAYDIYLLEEIKANNKNAKKALKNVGLKFKAFEFKTEKEAKAFAVKKAKEEGIDLSEDSKDKNNFWYGLANAGLGKLNGQANRMGDTYMYVTTEENQLKNEREGTATHEVGHLIFWDWIEKQGLNIDSIAKEITQFLKETNPKVYAEMFGDLETQRVETEQIELGDNLAIDTGKFKPEEVIMGFVERIGRINKDKKVTKTFMYRLGELFNRDVGVTTDLSTQSAIVDFISSMAEKIKDGTLSKADIIAAEESKVFKDLLTKEPSVKETKEVGVKSSKSNLDGMLDRFVTNIDIKTKSQAKEVSEKIEQKISKQVERLKNKTPNKTDEWYRDKAKKIIGAKELIAKTFTYPFAESKFAKEIGGIVEAITKRLYDPIPPDLKTVITRNEYKETLTADAGIMVDREYNGTQALDKFVSSRLNLRAQSLATRLGIEQDVKSSIDTDEARQIADQPIVETETEAEAKKEGYTNLVEANVLPAEMVTKMKEKMLLVTKTLKSRIDAAVSKNKTVTPLMSEIKKEMGVQADILFKKMLGAKRGGELRNNLLKLKKPILENMTTTWLQGAMPFAIEKSVNGKFTPDWQGKKIDRENVNTYKAGHTDGKPIVRRLPNVDKEVSPEKFLTYMFDENGDVRRGAKESLSKALAQEYAIDMYNSEFANPNSEIVKAFEANQTALGAQLFENYVQEFSRQAERGSVKRSQSLDVGQRRILIDGKNLVPIMQKIRQLEMGGKFTVAAAKKIITDGYKGKGIEESKLKEIAVEYAASLKKYVDNRETVGMQLDIKRFIKNHIEQKIIKASGVRDIASITGFAEDFDSIFGGKFVNISDDVGVQESNRATTQEYVHKLIDEGGESGFINAFKFMKGHTATAYVIGGKRAQYFSGLKDLIDNVFNAHTNINIEYTIPKGGKLKITSVEYNGKAIESFNEKVKQPSQTVKGTKAEFIKDFDYRKKEADAAFDFMIDYLTFIRSKNDPLLWISTMKSLDSNMKTMLKAAANVEYYFVGDYKGELVYEHMVPTNHMMIELTNHFWNKKVDLEALKESYTVGIVPKIMDKNINVQFKSTMPIDYALDQFHQTYRYYNKGTLGGKNIFALEKLGGENVGEVFGEGWVKFNSNLKPGAIAKANKNKTQQKALNNATKRSYSENSKGISVYDFDDTLAFSKSQIIVKKDGKTFKINAAQFAKQGETLLAEGAEFDFSEFNKVVKGQPGPLIPRIQKAIDKFGNKNIFILTARPVASETAIHAFMKGLGIDIPRANITGLANSTAQAKADWMVGKVAEGFNDFYFVDDAIKNVQAVRDVLETFDVKSKVQQAIAKTKRSMSSDLNKIIERNKGVRAETTYSKVLARKKGAQKGKFKLFVPYSAEDFKGLTSYTLAGKGKQGEADQRFFDRTLILPYTKGIAAMEGATQALKNDYKNLLDMFGLKKQLPKKIGDTDFTTDQAVRVYLWDKQGFDIPNISKRDQNKLSSLVAKDPDLVGFAEGLMAVSKKDNWVDPKDHWDVGSILKDLNDITDNVNRKEYLAEFIENVDEMFDKTTLNKLEAIYGTNYVEALQDSIRRMKSGSNTPRSAGKIERKWLNWVNNSVGTIMFFNRRSALLQMLSFTNFINWSDNNPAKAALAFGNQPLYWKKWVEIFNSDKLKERRGGLKSDIQESEIANQAKNSKDKAAAVVSYLLKIGFTPTQVADSFAIATGGATFLINRTKKYEKQGLSKKEAEAKAFEDFGRISDETQQSGDPMLISQQQSSHLGRLILAFQNTPMQYTRLMKKAGKDIINRRGSDVENLSKIAYYGFVQNLIFSSLQSALFALIPGFDDEEADDAKLEDKAIRTANSMVDTILRGSGLAGAVISTLKNAIMRYQKEDKKGYTADHTYTMLELANVSPPIGSKLRKIYSAIQTKKFNQSVIDEMGYDLTIDGKFNPSPNYEIIANISSAVGNLPLDRLLSEVKSINEAFDSRNTSYQRLALALGWRTWDVNVKNEEQDLIKYVAKKIKEKKSKETAREKRRAKKIEEADRLRSMSVEEYNKYMYEKSVKRKRAAMKAAETRRKNKFGG